MLLQIKRGVTYKVADDSTYNYDDQITDDIDITNTEIKINSDFYIHHALIKAQSALMKPDIKEGVLTYRIFIEHIEVLCHAAKIIDDDYEGAVKDYLESEEYQNLNQDKSPTGLTIKNEKLANYKLKLIMAEVFGLKTNTTPLKM